MTSETLDTFGCPKIHEYLLLLLDIYQFDLLIRKEMHAIVKLIDNQSLYITCFVQSLNHSNTVLLSTFDLKDNSDISLSHISHVRFI